MAGRRRTSREPGTVEAISRRDLLKLGASYSVGVVSLAAGGSILGCSDFVDCAGGNCVCEDLCVPRDGSTPHANWTADGECDDGGVGSDFTGCEHGTDCTDCGVRPPYTADLFPSGSGSGPGSGPGSPYGADFC